MPHLWLYKRHQKIRFRVSVGFLAFYLQLSLLNSLWYMFKAMVQRTSQLLLVNARCCFYGNRTISYWENHGALFLLTNNTFPRKDLWTCMLFSPVQVRSCDITLVKCVRQLLSLSRAYLCIIYIKRQKANFLSRKRLLPSENLVQPLFSVKTFYDPPPPPRPLKFLCRPCGIHNKCSLSVFKEDTN